MSTTKMLAPAGTAANTTIQTEFGNVTVASDLTVTVDSRCVKALESSGYTIFDDDLPIGSSIKGGSKTASAGEDTANTCSIVTGLSSVTTYHVQILRAGKDFTSLAAISESAGTITVADNAASYVLTAGDVIKWLALGVV